MLPPFQRIHFVNSQNAHGAGHLLLANGPSIFVFDAEGGRYQAQWRVGETIESQEPPAKKRKVVGADTVSDASSAEIVIEHGEDTKRPPKKRPTELPSVINLCGAQDGKHVIVATSEDKCIRVLSLSPEGKLSTLNERFLPKKASAIVFSTDQQTILCADKFGDVYELPLLVPKVQSNGFVASTPSESSSTPTQEGNARKPAASALTVHTKKNLAALRNQLAQSAKGGDMSRPRVAEYQPILGHVSLLTDILSVRIVEENKMRSYILTSDRDEHIRISRGIPQAHVIEGFCLGHSQFVSRLCIPRWNPTMLISGGGDDYIACWDWPSASLKQNFMIRPEIDRVRQSHGLSQDDPLTVSGIWALQTEEASGKLIVACEGVAALLIFGMDEKGTISLSTTLEMPSNTLDACVIQSQRAIIYVLDNVREPCSTTKVRLEQDTVQLGMHRWLDNGSGWEEVSDSPVSQMRAWSSQQSVDPASPSGARGGTEVYYFLEHLRKRGGAEDVE